MDNRAGIDCGSGVGGSVGRRRAKGENWDNCNRVAIKIKLISIKPNSKNE